MFTIIIVLIALCNVSYLNAISAGRCQDVPVIPDFDASKVIVKLILKFKLCRDFRNSFIH